MKKVPSPKDESEIRLIEITNYLSLQMEKIILKWLHTFISDKLDRNQFGGAKGHSIAHYLIEIMNFVLYNQDLSQTVSTLLTAVDLKKGFDKVAHNKIIYILVHQMETPTRLTRIIVSFLSQQKLSIRCRKEVSKSRDMPGGLPAGTIMGLNLFPILFNGAGPAASDIGIGRQISQPRHLRKPIPKGKVKWGDGCTVCTSINLKTALIPEDRALPRPRPYHARTEHRLPRDRNPMQAVLDSLCVYTHSHLMAINKTKTKATLCNTRTKWDFIPELSLNNEDNIEIVDEMKIVGYIMRSDMEMCSNTEYLVKKAFKRMWLIWRVKALA